MRFREILFETIIQRHVSIDTLPKSVKDDIVTMLMDRSTGFAEAYQELHGLASFTESYIAREIFGLKEPFFVNLLRLSPTDVDNTERSVSDLVVQQYQIMLVQSTAPPILVRKLDGHWRVVEGGHRLAAAKMINASSINAIDVSVFFDTNWKDFLDA